VLQIDDCRFDTGTSNGFPTIENDGTVKRNGHPINVRRNGLPIDSEIALPVQHSGIRRGRFLLTAATGVARPSTEQLRIAVALADQVGVALAGADTPRT
jgi:hypothetical protein